jgi:hypothetical protein
MASKAEQSRAKAKKAKRKKKKKHEASRHELAARGHEGEIQRLCCGLPPLPNKSYHSNES